MDYVDRVLIRRSKLGDMLAFAELVELYKDRMYNYLYRLTGNPEDSADLTQETFLRVYAKLEDFDDSLRFSPWIYKIAQNLAVDLLRKRKPVVYLDEPAKDREQPLQWQLKSCAAGPEELLEFKVLKGTVEQAIQELPVNYRSVLLLRYGEDMSYEDMARTLDIPVTTVKTRLHRARETLRERLVGHGFFNG